MKAYSCQKVATRTFSAMAIVLAALAATEAHAQSAPAGSPGGPQTTSPQSATPEASTPQASDQSPNTPVTNPEAIKVGNPEDIVVTGTRSLGGGQMKVQRAPEAISSITPEAIAQKTPLSSPLQLISTIPGANFGTSDAFGLAIGNYAFNYARDSWYRIRDRPAFLERWNY